MINKLGLSLYKEALQLTKGQALGGVHQIYYNLAKDIKNLINSQHSSTVHHYFDKIIQKILSGDAIHSAMFSKIPHLEKFNIFDLNNFGKNIEKAKELIDKANDEYQQYCDSLWIGFNDILTTYRHFPKNKTGFFAVMNRIINDYSYDGYYTAEKYQAFISLVDHLALLDTSGVLIEKLLVILCEKQTFYYQDQARFLDEVYLIFSQIQENYLNNLKIRDNAYINKLIEQYNLEDEESKKSLREYYQYRVNGKWMLEPGLPMCPNVRKLAFDIDQIYNETKESHENFQNHAEQLKDKIHRIAEELGLHFRIKKQTEEKYYDEKTAQEKENNEKFYYLEQDLAKCQYIISEKEQEDRQIKKRTATTAKWFSMIISIGEAFVSAATITTVYLWCPPIAIGLAVWSCASYINRLLFKGDVQDGLDDLFLKVEFQGKLYRRIFCDENGKPLSEKNQAKIIVAGVCCLATGIVCGALSFMSSYAVWPSILGLLSAHGTTLAVFSVAFSAGPASLMAVGITYLFGKVIADFIRKDRWGQIKKYIDDFFMKPYQALEKGEKVKKCKHIGKCALRVGFFLFAIGITMIATFASMGVFYQQTLSFLGALMSSGPTEWMKKLAQTATWVNAMISLPFQIEGTNKVLQPAIKRETFANLAQERKEEIELSPVQKNVANARKVGKVLVRGTSIVNGLGMGELNKISDASSLAAVHLNKLTGSLSSTVLSNATLAAATAYSIGPNMNAGLGACNQNKVDPLEYKIKETKRKNKFIEEKLHGPRLWSQHKSTEVTNFMIAKRLKV